MDNVNRDLGDSFTLEREGYERLIGFAFRFPFPSSFSFNAQFGIPVQHKKGQHIFSSMLTDGTLSYWGKGSNGDDVERSLVETGL